MMPIQTKTRIQKALEQMNPLDLQADSMPEGLEFVQGEGGLVFGQIRTEKCTGKFSLHGGHVCEYQPAGQAPVLFMSQEAVFADGKPIRGGIPICFPWFGPKRDTEHQVVDEAPSHGLVRTLAWDLVSAASSDEGIAVTLDTSVDGWRVSNQLTFGNSLSCELTVENQASIRRNCEVALHTYFRTGDLSDVCIEGLEQHPYLDQLTAVTHASEQKSIRFTEETDRIYQGDAPEITLADHSLNRKIIVSSRGSKSTVVWNPWIAKSARMSDFGDHEYTGMCCIETANIRPNELLLQSGEATSVWLKIQSASMP